MHMLVACSFGGMGGRRMVQGRLLTTTTGTQRPRASRLGALLACLTATASGGTIERDNPRATMTPPWPLALPLPGCASLYHPTM